MVKPVDPVRDLALAVEAMGLLLEELLALQWTQQAPDVGQLGRMRILARVARDRAEEVSKAVA